MVGTDPLAREGRGASRKVPLWNPPSIHTGEKRMGGLSYYVQDRSGGGADPYKEGWGWDEPHE